MKRVIVSVTTDLIIDQRVHKVCLFLKKHGLDVVLVGRKRKNSLPLGERSYKTKRMFLLFDRGPLFYAEYNIRLFFFLLFKRIDILVSNDLDTLLANYLISKMKGAKLVYDSHEYYTELPELQERKFVRSIWKYIEASILPKITHCYTVSQSVAEAYHKEYGIRMGVVRNVPMLVFSTQSSVGNSQSAKLSTQPPTSNIKHPAPSTQLLATLWLHGGRLSRR